MTRRALGGGFTPAVTSISLPFRAMAIRLANHLRDHHADQHNDHGMAEP